RYRTPRRTGRWIHAIPKAGANRRGVVVHVGIGLNPQTRSGRLHAELHGAWGLKPYRGQPDVRNSWEGGWKRGPGWNCEPTSQPKGRDWKPSTYRRARQCSTRQGVPGHGTVGGKDDGDTEPRDHLNATPTDSDAASCSEPMI